MTAILERFMRHVDTSGGPDACHLWTGGLKKGYGSFWVKGRGNTVAHRWLLGYLRGRPLLPSEIACHHCDNPPCVNDQHLYIGTHGSNAADSVTRHRHPNAVKTHCPMGHPYNADNTYRGSYRRWNERKCRICNREAVARSKAGRRALAEAGTR